MILAEIPGGCDRALDVGCGEGMLVRQLASRIPRVLGIDQDAASIELARRQSPGEHVEFILGDFLAYPLPAASFGMITCVAALHHMDAATALARMRDLLAPGGVLVINGVARNEMRDLPREPPAIVANLGYRARYGYWQHPSPVVWPPAHTYRQIRGLAAAALPGVRYRRHLLWRYSLVWSRPAG
jgi:SAM-dependent methyltransferase